MDNLGQVQQDTSSWIKKFFDYLETILEKYMQQFKGHKELSDFMKDEKNLYNEDGTLTQEYKMWIKKFELYCMENPVDKTIATIHSGNSNRLEFLEKVKDYLAYRQQLKDKYTQSANEEDWLNDVLNSPEKREIFEKLIDKELEQELDKLSVKND